MFRKPLLPVLIWTIVIALLTLIPGNYIPKVVTFIDWLSPDKLVHLFMFGLFIILLIEGFKRMKTIGFLGDKTILASFVIGMVFAIFTEAMQKFAIPGRNGNIYDLLADILGLGLGILIWRIIKGNDKKNLSYSKKI